MRRALPISLLLLLAILSLSSSSIAAGHTTTKVYLTKINATSADGLCLRLKGASLQLSNLDGDPATSFRIDPASLTIRPSVTVKYHVKNRQRTYLSARQSWKITDNTGEGVEILDNCLSSLTIVSKVDKTVLFNNQNETYSVPGHSFVIINSPAKGALLDYGSAGWLGFIGHYREKMWPILRPTEVVISPNEDGIKGGFPAIVEDTLCDNPISMSSN